MHAKRPVDWLGKLIEYKLGIFLVAGLFILGGETIIRLIVLLCFLLFSLHSYHGSKGLCHVDIAVLVSPSINKMLL